jgi:hypothetical protein
LNAGAAEGAAGGGDDLPSVGGYLDGVAVGIAEIYEDGSGVEGLAAVGEAQRDGLSREFAAARFGFEQLQGGAELEERRDELVLAMEGVSEPVAEEDRADGQEIVGEGCKRNEGAGEALGGSSKAWSSGGRG